MQPSRHQAVSLSRDCPAVLIPEGSPITLTEGTEVHITQALGGSVTVLVHGNLARIAAGDADAVGLSPDAGSARIDGLNLQEAVWEVLRTCYDPEIPINIVELGLVYGVQLKRLGQSSTAAHVVGADASTPTGPVAGEIRGPGDMRAEVVMTLTAPGCGMGDVLVDDVRQKLLSLPGVVEAAVELTFDPPWHQGMMSEAARLQTGLY
ncbi:MAG TPA: putative Fe-S cluster assembly protein SufT [Gammaproteobacteria bacterium]|nr:putative Fe-S cluster assembly protein SufT [Gammaproteobacteria bacterium]